MALWERQEGETKTAYDAFWAYCVVPDGKKRGYAKVAEKLSKSASLIGRWAKRWCWEERARAYDNHLVEKEIEAIKKQRVEAAKRQARIAKSFQGKIISRLNNLNPEELSAQDLARWFEVSVKIERQALGEPTELIAQELSGRDGGPVEIKREINLSNLSEEELTALEKTLLKLEAAEPK
jgi:hypothetical protein